MVLKEIIVFKYMDENKDEKSNETYRFHNCYFYSDYIGVSNIIPHVLFLIFFQIKKLCEV